MKIARFRIGEWEGYGEVEGDNVRVIQGSIFGVIESVSEDSIVIKVESGATMRVAKGSVALKRE